MMSRTLMFAAAGLLATAVAQAEPLVITHGGTFTGQWSSNDPYTPVIKIATREPVIIESSKLTGRGTLIDATAGGADVTVRQTIGTGMNPDIRGRAAGRFLQADEVAHLVIDHCELNSTAGVYIHRVSRGDPSAGEPSIQITSNLIHNIDGRRSNGAGGYLPFNIRTHHADGKVEEGFDTVQFVQFDGVTALAHGEIAWNEVTNDAGASRVEDNISIYESSGTVQSPLLIHDNCIRGAFTIDPTRSGQVDAGDFTEDWDYTGGGIMLGDGPGKNLASACGFIKGYANLVVGTSNYGIAIASGHDIEISDNRVISSGTLPDGRSVMLQNVGIYIWDTAHGKNRQPPTFFGDIGKNNFVGWMGKGNRLRNDWWVPDAAGWTTNQRLTGPITIDREQQEIAAWRSKAEAGLNRPGLSGASSH